MSEGERGEAEDVEGGGGLGALVREGMGWLDDESYAWSLSPIFASS